VPALEALLSAALEREELLGGVVETAALRRADTVKTALLRAVSHDLRSPLDGHRGGREAVGSPSVSEEERREMADCHPREENGTGLSRLVDKPPGPLPPRGRSRGAAPALDLRWRT